MEQTHLDFERDGAQRHGGAASGIVSELHLLFADQPPHVAGIRLHGFRSLQPFLAPEGQIGGIAASIVGRRSRAVRAILFDKTAETNWSLGWHQDRTICVRERVEVTGYGPWTIKGGMHHVAPPFLLLSRMVTLRVHLDDTFEDNAPLMIVPGSHRLGCIPESEIGGVVSRLDQQVCLAEAGDIWVYSTPIIHRSMVAMRPMRRRVLQIDFSGDDLPGELDWLGV